MNPILKQCCCFSLETGGLIIGWLYAIVGILSFISFVAVAIVFGISTDSYLQDTKGVLVAISVVLALFSIVNIVAGFLLIRGVRERNHRKMILILVLMIIGIISSFMRFIIPATVADIVPILIGVCIQIYFFICILSLYNKTKNGENSNQAPPQQYA